MGASTVLVLALLVNLLSALTLPLNGQSLSNPLNATLSPPTSPSNLSYPTSPFRYQIPPYSESQTSIIFTNYGLPVSHADAIRTLLEAQVIIMREIALDWRHADSPVSRTRTFTHNSVTVTIEPQPPLTHAYLGLWLSGALTAGEDYGFVECDMRCVDERAIFGPAGFTLGRGRLEAA